MADFEAGTRVEIVPFGRNHSHHYIAHLDGELGTVKGLKNHGKETQVAVRMDGTRATVDFPPKVLKPVSR